MKIEWAAVTVAVAVVGGVVGYLILEGEKMGTLQEENRRQDFAIDRLQTDKDRIVKEVLRSSEGLNVLGDRVSRLEGRMDAYHPRKVLVPPALSTDERGMR